MKLRSRWIVMPKFQWAIFGATFISFFIAFMAVAVMTYWSYHTLLTEGIEGQLGEKHPYFQFIKHQYKQLAICLMTALGLGAVIIATFTFFYSNKMAGPIHRLKLHLEDFKKNKELKEISFRKGDYLEDLAPLINSYIQEIKNKKNN